MGYLLILSGLLLKHHLMASLNVYICHGRGTLEIKCPYCHWGEDIVSAASSDKNFCLKKDPDGTFHLDFDHAFYCQIQA